MTARNRCFRNEGFPSGCVRNSHPQLVHPYSRNIACGPLPQADLRRSKGLEAGMRLALLRTRFGAWLEWGGAERGRLWASEARGNLSSRA